MTLNLTAQGIAATAVESLVQMLFVVPLLLAMAARLDRRTVFLIFLAVGYFIGYRFVLTLPLYWEPALWIVSSWNWSGKLASTVYTLMFYFVFRRFWQPYWLVRWRQAPGSFRSNALLFLVVVLISGLYGWFIYGGGPGSAETRMFHAIMPGLDEELAYRGVLLGLFLAITCGARSLTVTAALPAIVASAVLYGLSRGISLHPWHWVWQFSFEPFLISSGLGLVFGVMAVLARSMVPSALAHSAAVSLPLWMSAWRLWGLR